MDCDRKARSNERLKWSEPQILFLSFFGVGFSSIAPGTIGSAAAIPFLYLLGMGNAPYFFFIPFLVMLTIISSFIADITQRRYHIHDPSWIVIDEVIGISVTWLFLQSQSIIHYLIIFLLFRFFDIIKIWPATYFDQKVKHGAGTILDDVISGLFAGCVYLIGYFSIQSFL